MTRTDSAVAGGRKAPSRRCDMVHYVFVSLAFRLLRNPERKTNENAECRAGVSSAPFSTG